MREEVLQATLDLLEAGMASERRMAAVPWLALSGSDRYRLRTDVGSGYNVADFDLHEVASAKLAVDRQVE